MSSATTSEDVQQRLESLEGMLAATIAETARNEQRLRSLEAVAERTKRFLPVVRTSPQRETRAPGVRVGFPSEAPPAAGPSPSRGARGKAAATNRDTSAISDFLGGRALAWLGGIATLTGILLLLALAVSNGWIGREARVGLAAAGCAALMATGVWLHARRGRTEAAVAMLGAATAGAFGTLIVASDVYGLIPALVSVAGSSVVGALATTLAIRWAGRAIAVLGLIGALLSPLLVGAPSDGTTIAMLGVGAACAMAVLLWRRWPWLAFAAVVACAPQWALWISHGHSRVADAAVLVLFGSLGLLGAVFAQLRSVNDRFLRSAAALLVLNAVIVGLAGRLVLGEPGAALWLVGMALAHLGVGLWRWPRAAIHEGLRGLLLAIGVISGDIALSLALSGIELQAVWAVTALGFSAFVGRTDRGESRGLWLEAGLGVHVGLVLMRALIALPPTKLAPGPGLIPLASVAILAATCIGSARMRSADRGWPRIALDGLAMLAVLYMTAATLDGAALVGAWALEAVAAAELGRRNGDRVARYGALGFLGGATLHASLIEAPVQALVTGADSLGSAAVALGALAVASLKVGLSVERDSWTRRSLLAGSGLAVLFLASVAIVTLFQPSGAAASDTVLELGVRQQGQVLLSSLWGVVGVAGLIAGLRRNIVPLRTAALALLLATVAKVFLYDLSTLTSIYRVASCFVLGALLLMGAFAYQRLRPPPAPDLRTVHPSQR